MTATITSNQEKQFKRFMEDATELALKQAALDKDGLQALLERGGEFQAYVREGILRFSTRIEVYLDIVVGGKSRSELLTELKSSNHFVSDYAKSMMKNPKWTPGMREHVKFARIKIRHLGFTKSPTTAEVWARIQELGHSLCKPYDGPAIRLALAYQPCGDRFFLAMEQIVDIGGDQLVFDIGRDKGGKEWLYISSSVASGYQRDLDDEIVFRLGK